MVCLLIILYPVVGFAMKRRSNGSKVFLFRESESSRSPMVETTDSGRARNWFVSVSRRQPDGFARSERTRPYPRAQKVGWKRPRALVNFYEYRAQRFFGKINITTSEIRPLCQLQWPDFACVAHAYIPASPEHKTKRRPRKWLKMPKQRKNCPFRRRK